jgi:hypothetical protein
VKICKKCGSSFETINCPVCKKIWDANNRIRNREALNASSRKWNSENPGKRRAAFVAHYAINKEKSKATSTAWRKANPEREKASRLLRREKEDSANKARYAANKERYNSAASAWYFANKDKARELIKAWHKKNPDAHRIHHNNRRARKAANGGNLSNDLAAKLYKLQKGKCACCGRPLGTNYHLDHIMPLALGGRNEDRNIQLLLSECNSKKRAKHPVDFMQSKGFLL